MRDRPWFNDKAQLFLQTEVMRSGLRRAFEWGIGGSTSFFSSAGMSLTTVEHDPRWIREFKGSYPKHPGTILYVPLGMRYPLQPVGTYDLVCVDGRMRVECFKEALKHISPGGWLILDDSQRDRYKPAIDMVPEKWTRVRIYSSGDGGMWETSFFQRPYV